MTVTDISVFKCIWFMDGVKVILEPACRHQTHITSCRNVISIEHMASGVFAAFYNNLASSAI